MISVLCDNCNAEVEVEETCFTEAMAKLAEKMNTEHTNRALCQRCYDRHQRRREAEAQDRRQRWDEVLAAYKRDSKAMGAVQARARVPLEFQCEPRFMRQCQAWELRQAKRGRKAGL
jgi:hypothetical protein